VLPLLLLLLLLQLQNLGSSRWLPKSLVDTHMPELANAAPKTTLPVTLQLVLLPPEAADVSIDTPAQHVLDLNYGVTVRKASDKGDKKKGDMYMLAGLPFMRSAPVVEGWFLRRECCYKGFVCESTVTHVPYGNGLCARLKLHFSSQGT
jgi:hypothetical protein